MSAEESVRNAEAARLQAEDARYAAEQDGIIDRCQARVDAILTEART